MTNYEFFAYGERDIEATQEKLEGAEVVAVVAAVIASVAIMAFLISLGYTVPARDAVVGVIFGGVTGLICAFAVAAFRRVLKIEKYLEDRKEKQKDTYFSELFAVGNEIPDFVVVNGEEVRSTFARAMVQRERFKNDTVCYSVAGDHKLFLGKSPEDLKVTTGTKMPAEATHEEDGFHAVRCKEDL